MSREEFFKFSAALRTYYPREKLLPNKESMELWYTQLNDLSYEVAVKVLNVWVTTEKWSPSIAEIREKALELTCVSASNNWADGWEQILKAIRYYGRYREDEALESMDETTRNVAKRLGFRNLCDSENIIADRAQFRNIYEQVAERQKKQAQVPERIRNLISGTINNQGLISGGMDNEHF
jgi:hypothetical protein